MADPYENIRVGLRAQLQSFAATNAIDVAWENGYPPYEPTVGVAYLTEYFMPADVFQSTLGTNGYNRIKGLYQISLYYPAGRGTSSADTMAGKLITDFKRGTDLTQDGQTIEITKAKKHTAMQEPDWYIIPVRIHWKAEAENV